MSSVADRVREHRARRDRAWLITVAVAEVALPPRWSRPARRHMADNQGAIIDSVERLLEIFRECEMS
jgi:hypothetical protein